MCEGCNKVMEELRVLESQENHRHEEYLAKVAEYEGDKRELMIRVKNTEYTIEENTKLTRELAQRLVQHMEEEMEYNNTVSTFMVRLENDRKWILSIGLGIISALVWFYATQYIPDQKYITGVILDISKGELHEIDATKE